MEVLFEKFGFRMVYDAIVLWKPSYPLLFRMVIGVGVLLDQTLW
jgi:hypothetical protein